jgi:hypothetical protein
MRGCFEDVEEVEDDGVVSALAGSGRWCAGMGWPAWEARGT